MTPRAIELLAPARDLACGRIAVEHGADAVYIGAPRFGARRAAAASLDDIGRLVDAAHLFGAKVYVAMNTLLDDEEVVEAAALSWQLREIGVDALIIQDLGLLEAELAPLALHGSTQLDIRSAAKAEFLHHAGFSRIVLARELGLVEIRGIAARSAVELECFVHGSLCVGYSGKCYFSEAMTGRSGNRGDCAQLCRHRYRLGELDGTELHGGKYLLSLRDLDRGKRLAELVAAGVTSLKIEGRLKDEAYVANITAYYRQGLDRLIAGDSSLARASSGSCRFSFAPDPQKTFHRGSTDYFLDGRGDSPGSVATPKSTGEPLARVSWCAAGSLRLASRVSLHNGDGLCYFTAQGELAGFRVNRVDVDGLVHFRDPVAPRPGTMIYRNHDVAFHRRLAQSRDCRKIALDALLREIPGGLELRLRDEDSIVSTTRIEAEPQPAAVVGKVGETAARQLAKTGDSPFQIDAFEAAVDDSHHYPVRVFNDLRRRALAGHALVRLASFRPGPPACRKLAPHWPPEEPFAENVANRFARVFFQRCGLSPEDLARKRTPRNGPLLESRYCIREELAICPKGSVPRGGADPQSASPLLLSDHLGVYRAEFDCRRCRMLLYRHADLGAAEPDGP